MARVVLSALLEELVGKLAGSVFQDSYFGLQVRTRVSPRNPQTNYQQLRRGEFGFLSAGWRNLTVSDRQSFIDNSIGGLSGLNFYLQANINLTLIEEPTINVYVPSSDPGTMTVEFVEASDTAMTIKATGMTTVVPAGTKLLVQVTALKQPSRIFTNPSMYTPVISFDEGTDLSIPVDILSEWQSRYGQIQLDKRVCLKTSLIDKSNGRRGSDVINCTITEEMPQLAKLLKAFPAIVDNSGGNPAEVNAFSIPANTFAQVGDMVRINLAGETSFGGGSVTTQIKVDGVTLAIAFFTGALQYNSTLELIRLDADSLRATVYCVVDGNKTFCNQGQFNALDFTAPIDTSVILNGDSAGDMFIYSQSIEQLQQP